MNKYLVLSMQEDDEELTSIGEALSFTLLDPKQLAEMNALLPELNAHGSHLAEFNTYTYIIERQENDEWFDALWDKVHEAMEVGGSVIIESDYEELGDRENQNQYSYEYYRFRLWFTGSVYVKADVKHTNFSISSEDGAELSYLLENIKAEA